MGLAYPHGAVAHVSVLLKSKHLVIYLLVAGIIAASAAGAWAGYRADANKDRFSSEGGDGDGEYNS